MCRILPTYRSVFAQIVSCPQGLGTVGTSTRPLMQATWTWTRTWTRNSSGCDDTSFWSLESLAHRTIHPAVPDANAHATEDLGIYTHVRHDGLRERARQLRCDLFVIRIAFLARERHLCVDSTTGLVHQVPIFHGDL